MKIKLYCAFLIFALISCRQDKQFDYQKAAYRRITPSNVDSTKGGYIDYVATEDTNWGLRKAYYPNGRTMIYGYTYKGQIYGTSKAFYQDGIIKFITTHKNGNFDTGWYYDESGQLWYLRIRDTSTGLIRDSTIIDKYGSGKTRQNK